MEEVPGWWLPQACSTLRSSLALSWLVFLFLSDHFLSFSTITRTGVACMKPRLHSLGAAARPAARLPGRLG